MPELLRADREQLDRAAELLGGDVPALVIVVCEKPLVPAALEHLRKRASAEIPEPVVLRGSEEALGALMNAMPEIAAAKVRSLALGGDANEALRALNWHREKLLRGAPVVLWLDGVDGLTEMREAAPDAYSFRDMVVLVRGDGGRLPQVSYKEPRTILDARRRLARAKTALERASAHDRLSAELRIRGYLVEAEDVAWRGLEALPEARYTDENARLARASLWSKVAIAARRRGSRAQQRQAARRGLDEIQGLGAARAQEVLAWLLVAVPGPVGNHDRVSVERAFLLIQGMPSNPSVRLHATRAMGRIAFALGDVLTAQKLLGECDLHGIGPINLSLLRGDQGRLACGAGRMLDAESYFQQSISSGRREGVNPAVSATAVANCWLDRGELRVAEQIVRESLSESEPICLVQRQNVWGALALKKGELSSAREHVRTCLRDTAQFGLDGWYLAACGALAQIAVEGRDASRLDTDALERIAVELEVAEDVSRSITNHDPLPWYSIRFLGFRADVLVRTERCPEALDLARRALDLARATCTDLIPERGRALADHLLRAGKPEDALPIIAAVEPEAVDRGMLKELARLRAARVLALVLRDQPPGAIEPAMRALRDALESTGASRIKAETLLELAIRLPPATTLPDPFALASETHTLFVEMPMPAREARSLELAGDVLVARGRSAEAKRRYLTARGILERCGLGLRLPLLAAKLDRLG